MSFFSNNAFCLKIKLSVLVVLLLRVGGLSAQDIEQITKQKPFEIHGAVAASVGYYTSKGFNNTRKPYTYSIMAAPTISIYGVQIPFNFTFVEGSNSIRNPFAQFGVNPTWKWIKVYGGWTNMSWSPTTLNGKTFLGVGIEINPSLFRFGAMYGRFNPAIRENLLGPNPQQPQFKRRGFAFKIGVGNESNFFDFIFLKAKDVAGSIPAAVDSLNQLDYNASENAVFGIMSSQAMFKKKLVWQLDGSVSGFTRNLSSELLDIGTGLGTKALKVILPPRLSTGYAWTAHTNLTYKAETFSLGFDYNRIQPEFQSMGIDYIINDQQRFALNQSFSLKKGKVALAFSQLYQHDNLNNRKAAKTNRAGLTASVSLNPSQKFGIAFAYNNFFVFQQKGLREINDSTKLMMLQQTLTVSPRYTIINTKFVHNIYSAITYSRLDDMNKVTSRFTQNNTLNTSVGYAMSHLASNLSFAPAMNILYTKTPLFELLNVGPTVSISKTWWEGKINTSLATTYTASRQNNLWNSQTINGTIGLGYRINSHHDLRLNNTLMYTVFTQSTSNEFRGDLTYTYTF